MPLYEYRCRSCDELVEARRPMDQADAPIACSSGHTDAVRLLSVFAATGRAPSGASLPMAPAASGGCGSACACHG